MTILYNENYEGTMPFSDTTIQVNCAAAVEKTYTVPGDSTIIYQAIFSYNASANVFIRKNAAPTSPTSGTVTTEPYSEFRPYRKYVNGGDVLHFITPDTNAYIGVSLSQLQQ
jgi:hypothetical protein